MKTSDFDFEFPKELIAQEPAKIRDHSRLMVLNRVKQTIEHRRFYEIIEYLNSGDLLVLNNTKVIPANLVGRKEGGGAKIEVLLVKQLSESRNGLVWECLVKPGKRLKVGSKVIFGEGELIGKVLEKRKEGEQIIEFEIVRHFDNCRNVNAFWELMKKLGDVPLPPYIGHRTWQLKRRYQTVFAQRDGASAAPTAGLHFTKELLERIRAKGINIAYITLHTGLATFKPVYEEKIEDHKMYSEYFEVPRETIEVVRKAKRVIAVGTTSVRTLETVFASKPFRPRGETDLFIYPGYKFKVVDAMITNFHWPRSTLIMLVSAFAGRDFIMKAYREAFKERYRLFSFGDAMLIV